MKDFEKYIKDNQRKLDLDTINPKVWQSIEAGINGKKGKVFFLRKSIIGLTAAILVGVFCYQWFGNDQKESFPPHLLEDYGFKDSNVNDLLDTKINVIRKASIPVAYKNDLEMLLGQVANLDQHFAGKIKQLKLANSETELNREVLEYYKTKSEILDKVIDEIQKINSNEEEYQIRSEKTGIQL